MARIRRKRLTREELYSVVAGSPNFVLVLSREGTVRYGSPSLADVLGPLGEGKRPWRLVEAVHPGDELTLRAGLANVHHNEAPSALNLRLRSRDGAWRTFEGTVQALSADPDASVALHLREQESPADREFWDALTGLPARNVLADRLRRSMARAARQKEYGFAVMALNPDRLELINVSLGRSHADQFLEAFAQRLTASLRPADLVARAGSDVFMVLVDNIKDLFEATHVAERVREALSLPFDLGGHEVFSTASVGITLNDAGYERAEDMFRDAEVAMHRALARGGDRNEIFDKAMHARALARLQIETDLRRAVERREFRVHYQPIVSLDSGRISGFEALARWEHPERGLLPPAEFIPVAEETGLILPMSSQIFAEACVQVRAWQDRFRRDPPLRVSMNFTSTQFTQSEVESTILGAVKASGIEGSQVIVEITESVMMKNVDSVLDVLNGLKIFGIGIHIDDFGTGYSSLSYLHRLPVDALKVDRSFVSRLPDDGDADLLVRTIIDLAHNLQIHVVAEGIETQPQLERLRQLGCEYGQGFLFARPAPREAIEALLSAPERQPDPSSSP